jgi:hypothetical protein
LSLSVDGDGQIWPSLVDGTSGAVEDPGFPGVFPRVDVPGTPV